MKVTVIGSHLCPDTLCALNRLAGAGAEVEFKDILSCHAALQDYLQIRESSPSTRRSAAPGGWASPALSGRTAP